MGLCWLTTERCNQHCRYCDRFLEASELLPQDYHLILDKLISYGVKKISFGGGESLMLSCFSEIVEKGARNGMHLKLITNGKLLAENLPLLAYLKEVTFSMDSTNAAVNELLGRGRDHYDNIRNALLLVREKFSAIQINLNTVVTKINLEHIKEMSSFVEQWNIKQWKLLRFCPLRGMAFHNREAFEITDEQFHNVKENIKHMGLKCNLQFRDYEDMEKNYLLINPKGKLCVTINMEDVEVGDMLKDDLREHFV